MQELPKVERPELVLEKETQNKNQTRVSTRRNKICGIRSNETTNNEATDPIKNQQK